MCEFKKGDKVICIKTGNHPELIKNKIYEVEKPNGDFVYLKGCKYGYFTFLFRKECEYCKNDGYYNRNKSLISKTLKNNVDIDLSINVKDKKIVASIENLKMSVEDNNWFLPTKKINYCPMCRTKTSRKLAEDGRKGGKVMTKEQEEAIEYFKKHINYFKEQIKFIEAVDSDYYDEEYELYKNRVKQFETVLSMLKEKDAKIEHLEEKRNNQKAELAILNEKQKEMNKLTNTVSSYTGMFKKEQKDNKKKDKIIDLMAETIRKLAISLASYKGSYNKETINFTGNMKDIKQDFERKVKNNG